MEGYVKPGGALDLVVQREKREQLRLPKQIIIGIIGDEKCGKTSLINVFLKNTMSQIKERVLLSIQKQVIALDKGKTDLIIEEIPILPHAKNDLIKHLLKTVNVVFICHELNENDEKFNEEKIKYYIKYVLKSREGKHCLFYIVGCKLDLKYTELRKKEAFIYDKEKEIYTNYGQRVKTFVQTNEVKKFYCTSALLNFNVKELFEDAIFNFCYEDALKLKNKSDKHIGFQDDEFECKIF